MMHEASDSEIKKVVVIGPECTGKSELSEFLANHFNTVWVEEYARTYISTLDRPYVPEDLPAIAQAQVALEDTLAPRANKVLFCDTDLYVIKVWSSFKYGFVHSSILETIATRKYDLYLLSYVDVPWAYDPQREHPHQREELFDIYHREMQNQHVPFTVIKGSREQRRNLAIQSVTNLLQARL